MVGFPWTSTEFQLEILWTSLWLQKKPPLLPCLHVTLSTPTWRTWPWVAPYGMFLSVQVMAEAHPTAPILHPFPGQTGRRKLL